MVVAVAVVAVAFAVADLAGSGLVFCCCRSSDVASSVAEVG